MKLLDASLITNELTESKRQLEHEGFGKDPMSDIKGSHISQQSPDFPSFWIPFLYSTPVNSKPT
jgi:hypothetical protein